VAEAYRSIRTSLDLGDARSAKTILVASPTPGDGKSTTAGNLAIAFAQAGDRTLLLDCDLREPVQHLIFETEGAAGMSTVMPGETKLRDSILRTRVPNLYLLPCGPVPRTPAEMLASDRFKHLLRILCEAFDRIVIDSPSLEDVTDGRILAAAADVTVLVLRINHSMRRSAGMALLGLNEVGANVLGVVANDAPSVAAYRVDAGAGTWQYAAAAKISGETSAGMDALPPRNGELKPLSAPSAHFSSETITISEPDWPAEQP
jgi:capsular exopolysaccharide synthesis family protein